MRHSDIDKYSKKQEDIQKTKPQLGLSWHPIPINVIIILVLTLLGITLQYIFPPYLDLMRRSPTALMTGAWWRMITPIFANDNGIGGYLYVAIGLVLVGTVVERLFGRVQWLLFFVLAGLIGELIGYAGWDAYGAGASVAMCGLIGAYLSWLLIKKSSFYLPASGYILIFVAFLIASKLSNNYLFNAGLSAVIIFLLMFFHDRLSPRFLTSLIGSLGLLGALTLTFLQDIHGPPVLMGAVLGALSFVFNHPFKKFTQK